MRLKRFWPEPVFSLARMGWRACLPAAGWLLVAACATPAQRADRLAVQAGLTRVVLTGTRFQHIAYERLSAAGPLYIYIEGDGRPWIRQGREIAADPTPKRPLALELALGTRSRSVLYLGRPCYFGLAPRAECQSSDWTFGRYSKEVVDSLVAAANRVVTEHGFTEVVLIGHSGGGALVVLMAPRVEHVRAVVTIAANLDVAAWGRYHGYLPLTASLDPADQAPLASDIIEIHLTGGADRNVPAALLTRYLARHPAAQVWPFAAFDHLCCWARAWPSILSRLSAQIGMDSAL